MTEKNYFNNLISNTEHFIDVPDCIADGESYKETITNCFKITNGILKLGEFRSSENDNEYLFDLKVNDESRKLTVKKMSDYVDSNGLIHGLNQILHQSKYEGTKQFCDINGGVADFGVAFITKDKEVEIAKNGLIWRNEEFYQEILLTNSQPQLSSEHKIIDINSEHEIKEIIEKKSNSQTNSIKPWWKFW